MTAVIELASDVGLKPACDALGVSRATLYRRQRPKLLRPIRRHWRALSVAERATVLEILYDPRFVDASFGQVYATLLEEGVHLASEATMYRILRGERAVRERRAVRRHPVYARPELVATGPNQLWSWDITKIRGPERRVWLHLYVIIDVYSRKVVGWLLATTETAALAERFIQETHEKEGILPGSLTLHSDRGTSMRSKTVTELLDDLGVVKSRSRPRISNDNPFSEAQFKTMKYCPFFPGSFASVAEGRAFFQLFFAWYNNEHHHSGIAMFTPATVHGGLVEEVAATRQASLAAAYAAHPERFVRGPPSSPGLPRRSGSTAPPASPPRSRCRWTDPGLEQRPRHRQKVRECERGGVSKG